MTGASGFIASWLVKLLLERGYTVRASVRDPGNSLKIAHLISLPGANERLELVKADLLDDGSFDSAVDGCAGVFHTASPFFFNTTNPQNELIDPALQGTINIVNACVKAKSVKRLVLTSSTAAVLYSAARKPEDVVDEQFWSDPEYCCRENLWYQLSKTLAEKEAWKLSKEHGLNLITVNPAMVVGPLLQSTMNTSSEIILRCLNGSSSTYPNAVLGWVHVKDVAEAHILAFEVPTASGRYICAERVAHYEEIMEILRKLYPDYPIPTKCVDETNARAAVYKMSTRKIHTLGLKYTPIEEALRECSQSLLERNLVTGNS